MDEASYPAVRWEEDLSHTLQNGWKSSLTPGGQWVNGGDCEGQELCKCCKGGRNKSQGAVFY